MMVKVRLIVFFLCLYFITTSSIVGQENLSYDEIKELCKDTDACAEYLENLQAQSLTLLKEDDYSQFLTRSYDLAELAQKLGNKQYEYSILGGIFETHFMYRDYDQALFIIDSLLTAGWDEPYHKARLLYRKGFILSKSQDVSKGITMMEDAMTYAEEILDSSLISLIGSDLGVAYTSDKRYAEAINVFLKSSSYSTFAHNKGKNYLKVHDLFDFLGNRRKSLEYHVKSGEFIDTTTLAYYHSYKVSWAYEWINQGEYVKAESQLLEVLEYLKNNGGIGYLYAPLIALSCLELDRRNIEKAGYYLSEVDPSSLTDYGQKSALLRVLIDYHLTTKDYSKAKYHLAEYEALYQETEIPYMRNSIDKRKIKVFRALGMYKEALSLSDNYYLRRDSLYRTGQDAIVYEMEGKYNKALSDQEIEKLNYQNELANLAVKRRNRLLWLTICGLLGLGIFATAIYRLYLSNKKQKVQLADINTDLSKALNDKAILLKEIHHRVKNNLQVVSSLLGLQSRYIEDDQALDALKIGRARVQSMSLLHKNLYSNEDLKSIGVLDYFTDLGQNLFHTYNTDESNISFYTEIDDLELDVDVMVPLGLIMNELISNALKHAFIGRDSGEVHVKIKEKENSIVFSVIDNGVGLRNKDFMNSSETLGVQLVKSFADKLEAHVETVNQGGSHINIIVPKAELLQNERDNISHSLTA